MADKLELPAGLTSDNMYHLLEPVKYQVGDEPETLRQLQLRRMTGAELEIMDKPIAYTVKLYELVEAMTDLPRIVVRKIDAADWDRLDDVFGYFRQPGSVTGAIS